MSYNVSNLHLKVATFQDNIVWNRCIQCSRTFTYFSSVVVEVTATAMNHSYRTLTKIWHFSMAYHHAKTSCPVRAKNVLVLCRMLQTFADITQNEQLIDEDFYGEKI